VTDADRMGDDERGWVMMVSHGPVVRAFALPSNGAVVIGRDADCAVTIDHEKISRRHARLRLDETWHLEDLGSRNGTTVSGRTLVAEVATTVVAGETMTFGPFVAVIVPRAVQRMRTAVGAAALVIDEPTLERPTATIVAIATSAVNLLVIGETGVGKEVLARSIHAQSGRRGPFVAVNCAAIAAPLLESELFGYEKGAFTGAFATKLGLLEAAAGGTVLLDEIGEMSADLQAKLLRVIEIREVLRVGGVRPVTIDVRVIAATHRDLLAATADGGFRRDLYYRLAGFTLSIPPLRERPHQVLALAARFAGNVTLSAAAAARLRHHSWPGNVRELKNVVERARLLSGGDAIDADHLLFDGPEVAAVASPGLSAVEADERDRIVAALDACAGNQTHAAKLLGMSRATLVQRLTLYRIARPRKGR
jgi:two-component system response regulator AtoC